MTNFFLHFEKINIVFIMIDVILLASYKET